MADHTEHNGDPPSPEYSLALYERSFQDLNEQGQSEFSEIAVILRVSLKDILRRFSNPKTLGVMTVLVILGIFYASNISQVTDNGSKPPPTSTAEITPLLKSSGDSTLNYGKAAMTTSIPPATSLPTPETTRNTSLIPRTPDSHSTTSGITGCVNVSQLRIRAGPGTDTSLADGATYGDCFEFIYRSEQNDGFWLGFNHKGELAWVKAQFIDLQGELDQIPVYSK